MGQNFKGAYLFSHFQYFSFQRINFNFERFCLTFKILSKSHFEKFKEIILAQRTDVSNQPQVNHISNLMLKLWWWRRILRVSWTARRSNQSILKEIGPEYSVEGLMLKLKLQYSGHLMWRTDSLKRPWCWQRLKVEGQGDDGEWDGWMASPNQWTWVWVNSGSWWWTGRPGVLQSMRSQRVGHDWATELSWWLRIASKL